MNPLRIAIIGAGLAGGMHARAIKQTVGVTLGAVSDLDEQAARRVAGESEDACSVWSAEQIMRSPDIDAVVIATPEPSHMSLAAMAVDHRKPVLIEKPVANRPEDIRELLERARHENVLIIPGHNYAYLPECARLIRGSRAGALGTVRALHINYAIRHTEDLAARYDGVLAEVMVHHAYLALAVLGKPDRVSGGQCRPSWNNLTQDDQAWMVWEYESGEVAMMFASFAVDDWGLDPMTFSMKALGTGGTSSCSWRSHTTTAELFNFGIPLYEETYVHQMAAFRDSIHGQPAHLSTLDDALTAAEIIKSVAAQRLGTG